jgi:hypothetical protein
VGICTSLHDSGFELVDWLRDGRLVISLSAIGFEVFALCESELDEAVCSYSKTLSFIILTREGSTSEARTSHMDWGHGSHMNLNFSSIFKAKN